MLFIHLLGLIHEALGNLRPDIKVYLTKNLFWIQEDMKLCSGNADLIINTCVHPECLTIRSALPVISCLHKSPPMNWH